MPPAARLGDYSKIEADAHGCPGCPHPGIGPAIVGSPDVYIEKRPAIRKDDTGIHAVCCGPNMWTAQVGSTTVNINGKPAHRKGDADKHCGGMGTMDMGADTVNIGG